MMHDYQRQAVAHLVGHDEAGLFLDMGLGKTLIVLAALAELDVTADESPLGRTLIVAPKRVVESVWPAEIDKWGFGFSVSLIVGTSVQRMAAIDRPADVHIVSRDNVSWLVRSRGKFWKWETLIIDELSSFKGVSTQRSKALRHVRPLIKRVWGLTGTPAPKGLIDLWPQMKLIDGGARLGKTVTSYRERYFTPGLSNGHVVYSWNIKPGSEEAIYSAIEDVCLSMRAKDKLTLPDFTVNDVRLELPKALMSEYRSLKRDMVRGEIVAANAAVLTGKLRQFASGFLYHEDGTWDELHSLKLEVLEGIIEESQGSPVLVFYDFKATRARIPGAAYLDGADSGVIQRWNRGEIPVLAAHPASTGHGLNLQAGGHTIVWWDLPWSSETWLQANARLHRQGQSAPVVAHRLIVVGTVDDHIVRVLDGRVGALDGLLDALRPDE